MSCLLHRGKHRWWMTRGVNCSTGQRCLSDLLGVGMYHQALHFRNVWEFGPQGAQEIFLKAEGWICWSKHSRTVGGWGWRWSREHSQCTAMDHAQRKGTFKPSAVPVVPVLSSSHLCTSRGSAWSSSRAEAGMNHRQGVSQHSGWEGSVTRRPFVFLISIGVPVMRYNEMSLCSALIEPWVHNHLLRFTSWANRGCDSVSRTVHPHL